MRADPVIGIITDFEGALALLEFNLKSGERTKLTNWWIGYCAFHLGRYQRAIEAYEDQLRELDRRGSGHSSRSEGKRSDAEEKTGGSDATGRETKAMDQWSREDQEAMLKLHLACCRFYLGGMCSLVSFRYLLFSVLSPVSLWTTM